MYAVQYRYSAVAPLHGPFTRAPERYGSSHGLLQFNSVIANSLLEFAGGPNLFYYFCYFWYNFRYRLGLTNFSGEAADSDFQIGKNPAARGMKVLTDPKLKLTNHANWVRCVRWNPDGDHFATARLDMLLWFYRARNYIVLC
jgi:hypothetical protein